MSHFYIRPDVRSYVFSGECLKEGDGGEHFPSIYATKRENNKKYLHFGHFASGMRFPPVVENIFRFQPDRTGCRNVKYMVLLLLQYVRRRVLPNVLAQLGR